MLDAALEKKPEMYKTWLSKQHTGFCGTRLQVSHYKGRKGEQAWRPNCGRIETTAHLCLCPNEDRTKLFLETTDELEHWMVKDNKTNHEVAFWIPRYILMRGTKHLHVSTNNDPRKKPRCNRMEEFHGRKNIQRILGHPKPPLGARKSQNQRRTMGETIHQQDTPHNTQPVDIQELYTT